MVAKVATARFSPLKKKKIPNFHESNNAVTMATLHFCIKNGTLDGDHERFIQRYYVLCGTTETECKVSGGISLLLKRWGRREENSTYFLLFRQL